MDKCIKKNLPCGKFLFFFNGVVDSVGIDHEEVEEIFGDEVDNHGEAKHKVVVPANGHQRFAPKGGKWGENGIIS